MGDQTNIKPQAPIPTVELLHTLQSGEMEDLCDATDAAIKGGGGFGWVELPAREILERYWQGVLTMPTRYLFVARLDGVICGTCQLVKPPSNNQAQSFAAQLMSTFVAPWARGHGLAKMLVQAAEAQAVKEGFSIINLDVRETMHDAIKMYEELGFVRVGTHPYYAKVKGEVLKGYYYYKVIDPESLDKTT